MTISLCMCGCGQPAPIASRTNRAFGHVKGQPVRYIKGHYRPRKPKKPRPALPTEWPTCACGCGEPVPAYTKTTSRRGIYAGMPRRFVGNHSNRGEHNPAYSGKDEMWKNGRCWIRQADGSWKRRYHVVMERMLGRPLRPGEGVHHKDEDPANDAPDNLELFTSNHEHRLKHGAWTKEMAIAALRDAAEKLGHAPTTVEFRVNGFLPTTKVIHRLFGSWPDALAIAGLLASYHPQSSNQFIRKRA